MKKIFLIFSIFLVVFPSCETDFDVHAEWQEITVVYGLLDQSQDRQYIKINKAFLGNESAFVMANNADSFNYDPNKISVILREINNGQELFFDSLSYIVLDMDTGIFSNENNIVYYTTKQLTPL